MQKLWHRSQNKTMSSKRHSINKCNEIGHLPINADLLKVFFKVHRSRDCGESHSPSHAKVPKPALSRNESIHLMTADGVLEYQILAQFMTTLTMSKWMDP